MRIVDRGDRRPRRRRPRRQRTSSRNQRSFPLLWRHVAAAESPAAATVRPLRAVFPSAPSSVFYFDSTYTTRVYCRSSSHGREAIAQCIRNFFRFFIFVSANNTPDFLFRTHSILSRRDVIVLRAGERGGRSDVTSRRVLFNRESSFVLRPAAVLPLRRIIIFHPATRTADPTNSNPRNTPGRGVRQTPRRGHTGHRRRRCRHRCLRNSGQRVL